MNIGLTGTIGSGKSTVGKMLAFFLQAHLIDTDIICRQLMEPMRTGWMQIRERWPEVVNSGDNQIDKKMLRHIIFNDDTARQNLESILHPHVEATVTSFLQRYRISGQNLIIEVPLLFEVAWQGKFDHCVSVYVERAVCQQRTFERDKIPVALVAKILDRQKTPEEKAQLADNVIDNSHNLAQTFVQVTRLGKLLQRSTENNQKANILV